jgi:hypothetical protein
VVGGVVNLTFLSFSPLYAPLLIRIPPSLSRWKSIEELINTSLEVDILDGTPLVDPAWHAVKGWEGGYGRAFGGGYGGGTRSNQMRGRLVPVTWLKGRTMEERMANERDKPSQNDNMKTLTIFLPGPTTTSYASFRVSIPRSGCRWISLLDGALVPRKGGEVCVWVVGLWGCMLLKR